MSADQEDIGIAGLGDVAQPEASRAGQNILSQRPRHINIAEASNGFVLNHYGDCPGDPSYSMIAATLDDVLEAVRNHFS